MNDNWPADDSVFIQRAPHRRDFVQVSNDTARDPELSWAARGMLLHLLSLPDDWIVRQADLIEQSPDGRTVVRRCFRELEAARYMQRQTFKGRDGRWHVKVVVHERPVPGAETAAGTRGGNRREPGAETAPYKDLDKDLRTNTALAPSSRADSSSKKNNPTRSGTRSRTRSRAASKKNNREPTPLDYARGTY